MTVRLFVDKVPPATTKTDLARMFSSYGRVEAIYMIPASDTGSPARFAMVDMHHASDAYKAITDMRHYALGAHNMTVMVSRAGEDSLSEVAQLQTSNGSFYVSRMDIDSNLRQAS